MRILVDQSGYSLKNMGDVSMLQVALLRLSSLFPGSTIHVFTTAPETLSKYCPNAKPLLPFGRSIWFGHFIPRVGSLKSNRLNQRLVGIENYFRKSFPSSLQSLLRSKLRLQNKSKELKEFEEFTEAFLNANLVVATGGGYINEPFQGLAISILETLGLAAQMGKATAMFGQGLGPIQSQTLLTHAQEMLPSVDLIALREKRAGIPLLTSVGVSQQRVITTGDDAIELAYKSRTEKLGNAIGINLRAAEYAGITSEIVETVRVALHEAASRLGSTLLPVPIDHSFKEGYMESDSVTIQRLLKGFDDDSNGGSDLDTPLKVIEQAGRCRVVITGSYHAGVFALSQGIPIVGLAKSKYYADKFLGLADQFGIGCSVIFLDDPRLKERVVEELTLAWQAAEEVRPKLLEAAERQIELSRNAYKRLYELVNSR